MTMHRKKYSQTRKIDYEERNKENSDSEDESKKARTDKDGTLRSKKFEGPLTVLKNLRERGGGKIV